MRHFVSGARELHGRASVHAHRASRIAHRASRIAHRASRIAHRASRIAHRASRIAHRASRIAHRRIRRPDRHGASARNAPMPGRPSHAARSTPEQLPVDAVYMTPCSGM
nr:aminopeptidase [Burkholderia pseudomallei]